MKNFFKTIGILIFYIAVIFLAANLRQMLFPHLIFSKNIEVEGKVRLYITVALAIIFSAIQGKYRENKKIIAISGFVFVFVVGFLRIPNM